MTAWTDREVVDELCDIESGLNPWELGFVDDMARRLDCREELSIAMRVKAEQILREQDP